MDLMFQPLRKYADFTGRARRSEYWLFALMYVGLWIAFVILSSIARILLGQVGAGLVALLFVLAVLGMIIPSLAVNFRRLHDTNRSAWWTLIGLVPIAGPIVLLVFHCLPGTSGPNPYGPDPKMLSGESIAGVFS